MFQTRVWLCIGSATCTHSAEAMTQVTAGAEQAGVGVSTPKMRGKLQGLCCSCTGFCTASQNFLLLEAWSQNGPGWRYRENCCLLWRGEPRDTVAPTVPPSTDHSGASAAFTAWAGAQPALRQQGPPPPHYSVVLNSYPTLIRP